MDSVRIAVVVSLPRCGSTLMCEVLEQHPEMLGLGEVFIHTEDGRKFYHEKAGLPGDPYDGLNPITHLIRLMEAAEERGRNTISFKLMDYQEPRVWEYLEHRDDAQIIYVRRDNLLDMAASAEGCAQSGSWHAHTPDDIQRAAAVKVDVPPALLIELQDRRERLELKLRNTLGKNPTIIIQYEDLTGRFAPTTSGIYRRLGLSEHPAHLTQSKLHRTPIQDRVTNYHELREHFRGTSLARYFV